MWDNPTEPARYPLPVKDANRAFRWFKKAKKYVSREEVSRMWDRLVRD
jgi:hypothetical protein